MRTPVCVRACVALRVHAFVPASACVRVCLCARACVPPPRALSRARGGATAPPRAPDATIRSHRATPMRAPRGARACPLARAARRRSRPQAGPPPDGPFGGPAGFCTQRPPERQGGQGGREGARGGASVPPSAPLAAGHCDATRHSAGAEALSGAPRGAANACVMGGRRRQCVLMAAFPATPGAVGTVSESVGICD